MSLEDITPVERHLITEADATRILVGNAAEVWQLTVKASSVSIVAESLFTLPLGNKAWQVVADRVFSILAAVDLAPEQGWREIRSGHFYGPVKELG